MLERTHPRIYQWVKPRSLLLHLALLAIAAGCLTAAWWQIQRAMQGNTLSYLYSLEWPAFVVVAGIGWWQMVHDTPEDIAARRAFHERMRRASAEVVARSLPRSARALTVGSEEVHSRVLESGDRRVLDAATGGAAHPVRTTPTSLVPTDAPDLEAILLDTQAEQDEPADEMTEYNRYLALLALKGKPKTWRNPRGV
ncbi:MAG: hypothetical protein JO337_06000 [Acidimicrobiales bacterium]|nr:hypothetical protein [Acidimicrobiales bacterium]